MDISTLEPVLKVAVPIGTFVLGIAVTLITKHVEKRRAELKERVTAVAKLVNEWYNQIHQLGSDVITAAGKSEIKRAIYFYVRNRLVLPELTLHLAFLKERKAEPALVQAVEEFLEVVTTTQSAVDASNAPRGAQIDDIRFCRTIFDSAEENSEALGEEVEKLLHKLDAKLQQVTRLSANALATKA